MNFDIATLPYLEVWKRRARWRRRTSRPVSRVLCLDVLHVERRPSISTCRHRQALAVYPQTRAGRPRTPAQAGEPALLDLAPSGVYRAAAVTRNAGGLLHRRFTLTGARAPAVCFLWHCPAGRPGLLLATTLPCGVRTFLAPAREQSRGRPVGSSAASSILRASE